MAKDQYGMMDGQERTKWELVRQESVVLASLA
jgi:hypothetical protein